ncbi:MAG: DUF3971 domain-containing protein [Pseudomonadota bacterium]
MTEDAPDREPEEGVDAPPPLPGGAHQVPKKRRRFFGVGKRWVLASVLSTLGSIVVALIVVGVLLLMGRSVSLPDRVAEMVETRINDEFDGPEVELSGIRVGLQDNELRPTLELQGLRLAGDTATPMMALPVVQVKLDTSELIQGRIALETLDIRNARVNLIRGFDGQLSFTLGAGLDAADTAVGSVADVLRLVDQAFEHPAARELEEVSIGGLGMQLSDLKTARELSVADGRVILINGANFLALTVAFEASLDDNTPAQITLRADKAKGGLGGRFRAEFANLRVRDVAEQVRTLDFLSVLDAPVSGNLTSEFGGAGQLVSFAGELDIGAGALQPAPQAKPLPLNAASTQIRYSAATGRLHLEDLMLDAPELRLSGKGHADLQEFDAGVPQVLLMQMRLEDIELDPKGVFETPIRFSEAQADMRYRPAALKAELGQLVLRQGTTEITSFGTASVAEDGWRAAIDAHIGEITQSELMALWPTTAVEPTRNWLSENIISGSLKNAAAAIRVRPGKPPDAAVSFDFSQAKVRYVKTLPVIEDGRGYLSIFRGDMTLALHEGHVITPNGQRLEMGGSVMQIPKVDQKIPDAEFYIAARGPLQAAMSLLDEKPFEFLSKSGVPVDLANGAAVVTARLNLPLAKDLKVRDVAFDVEATLNDVSSKRIVTGSVLSAQALRLTAKDTSLKIYGPARLNGVPLSLEWARAIGPGSGDGSQASGVISLSQATLDALDIGLPEGTVSGSGEADYALVLEPGTAPLLKLSSDLRGIGLRIDALGWSKAQSQTGDLQLQATLGDVPEVDALSISAPGISAQGRVVLNPDGGLQTAVFDPLRIDGRIDARVELTGRGKGVPVAVAVRGGTVDIRNFETSGAAQSGGGAPLDLALARLRITDAISINDFRGRFQNRSGLDGSFTGKVNGGTEIRGALVPTRDGLAIRMTSANGGGVLSSTGLFQNARGGEMSLVLRPNGGAGRYLGQLTLANTRIKKAPVLADLLSALSIVGLLEQLSGEGILFSEVDAIFALSPGGVTVREARAVGPSMGITLDGVYANAGKRMQMQGVISPIYMLNRPLGFLFSKRGEGLFGFTYQVNGSVDAPRVSVNPLSVFTPGIFREMFRRDPPEPQN